MESFEPVLRVVVFFLTHPRTDTAINHFCNLQVVVTGTHSPRLCALYTLLLTPLLTLGSANMI